MNKNGKISVERGFIRDIKLILIGSIMSVVLVILMTSCYSAPEQGDKPTDFKIGQQLLEAMYLYDPFNLLAQDDRLMEVLDEDMYWLYALTYDQRQLNAFLRYQQKPAVPHIVHQEEGRIIFWIENEAIARDRTFQIEFRYEGSKIIAINESEIYFIPPSGRDFYQ